MFVRVWLRHPPACRRKEETGGRRQSAATLADIAEYGALELRPSAAPPDRPTVLVLVAAYRAIRNQRLPIGHSRASLQKMQPKVA